MKDIKLLFCASILSGVLFGSHCSVPFEDESGFSRTKISINSRISSIKGNNYADIGQKSENVYVIFFSTTWCCNCPEVAKSLSRLAETLNKRFNNTKIKFIYIIVGNESNEAVEEHFKDLSGDYVDVCSAISCVHLDGIRCVPSCIVLDKCGNQVFRYDGQKGYDCDEFKDFLISLVNANESSGNGIRQRITADTKKRFGLVDTTESDRNNNSSRRNIRRHVTAGTKRHSGR